MLREPHSAPSSGKILSRLGSDKSLIILARERNDLHCVRQSAVERVGESDGESRRQKIDID